MAECNKYVVVCIISKKDLEKWRLGIFQHISELLFQISISENTNMACSALLCVLCEELFSLEIDFPF